ncbi:MAG: hypothetical protein DWH80_05460 [Planctomycetota bacterium]|nr:MAG: hypothetical protein DWH80_05460 [Planctomycetota bacterium]
MELFQVFPTDLSNRVCLGLKKAPRDCGAMKRARISDFRSDFCHSKQAKPKIDSIARRSKLDKVLKNSRFLYFKTIFLKFLNSETTQTTLFTES